eukprot:gene11241-18866_t
MSSLIEDGYFFVRLPAGTFFRCSNMAAKHFRMSLWAFAALIMMLASLSQARAFCDGLKPSCTDCKNYDGAQEISDCYLFKAENFKAEKDEKDEKFKAGNNEMAEKDEKAETIKAEKTEKAEKAEKLKTEKNEKAGKAEKFKTEKAEKAEKFKIEKAEKAEKAEKFKTEKNEKAEKCMAPTATCLLQGGIKGTQRYKL